MSTEEKNIRQSHEEGQSGDEAPIPALPFDEAGISRDSYGALHSRDFRLLLIGVFLAMFGQQMIGVALGWELYERTGSALVLGFVGLAQVLPVIALFLPAGYIIDRYNRKYVVLTAQFVLALAELGLALLSYARG